MAWTYHVSRLHSFDTLRIQCYTLIKRCVIITYSHICKKNIYIKEIILYVALWNASAEGTCTPIKRGTNNILSVGGDPKVCFITDT